LRHRARAKLDHLILVVLPPPLLLLSLPLLPTTGSGEGSVARRRGRQNWWRKQCLLERNVLQQPSQDAPAAALLGSFAHAVEASAELQVQLRRRRRGVRVGGGDADIAHIFRHDPAQVERRWCRAAQPAQLLYVERAAAAAAAAAEECAVCAAEALQRGQQARAPQKHINVVDAREQPQ
jgi:hypothetical protein